MMDKMKLIESPISLILQFIFILYVTVICSIIFCSSKKTPQKKKKISGDRKKGPDAQVQGKQDVGQVNPGAIPPPEAPKVPAQGGIAGTFDPNYQTLAGVGGEVFGEDKKKDGGGMVPQAPAPQVPAPQAPGPQAPPGGGMAGTYDPNYQTLAGVGGDVFGQDKKRPVGNGGGVGGAFGAVGPRAPINQDEKAGTFDPNYQTLAGVGGEVFGADKKKDVVGDGPKAPDNQDVKAGTFDPNYQTLAGVGGDVFGQDKKQVAGAGGGGGDGGAKPQVPQNQDAKAGTFDPNYQTLAGIGGDVFGADKKM